MYDTSLIICPGETLKEQMEDLGLSISDASDKSGLSEKKICGILDGTERIDKDAADAIRKAVGTPAVFWLRLQRRFDCESALYSLSSASSFDEVCGALIASSDLVDKLLKVRYEIPECLMHLKKVMECAQEVRDLPGGGEAAEGIMENCASYAERLRGNFSDALEASLNQNSCRDRIVSDLKQLDAHGIDLVRESSQIASDLSRSALRGDDPR